MFQWLKSLFENRSLHLATATGSELEALGLRPAVRTESGFSVSPENATTLTAVRCAVTILSESFGTFPCVYYKRNGNKKEKVWHPRSRLVNDFPNDEMTAIVFKQSQMMRAVLWGFSADEIVRDGNGEPLALWPIMPNRVRLDRVNGKLVFIVKDDNFKEKVIKQENVLYVPGLTFDGLSPDNPIMQARECLALTKACEVFGARFFGEGCPIPWWLVPTVEHGEENRRETRESMLEYHAGHHKFGMIPWGYSVQNGQTVAPEEGQFLETRQFQINEVARLWNCPPHRLKNLDRATWANISDENQSFIMDTMKPWLVKFEQEYNRKLILPSEQDEYFFEFNIDAVLRGDERTRYAIYTMGVQGGWLTPETICEWENLPMPKQKEPDEEPFDVGSMTAVVDKLASGEYPPEATLAILTQAFPDVDQAVLKTIVDSVAEHAEEQPEEEQPQESPVIEPQGDEPPQEEVAPQEEENGNESDRDDDTE